MNEIILSVVTYFELFFSAPIIFYSAPFVGLVLCLFLSFFGVAIDVELDGVFSLDIMRSFFGKYDITRIPLVLFLIVFFMFGSILSTMFSDLISSDTLYVSIFMIAIIYPLIWLSVVPLSLMKPLFYNDSESFTYIGQSCIADSVVTINGGWASCYVNNYNHQLDVHKGDKSPDIIRGDELIVLFYDEDLKSYLVEKK